MARGYKMVKKKIIKNTEADALMRKAGFNRVSDEASAELVKILERFAVALAQAAKESMDVGGRKTPKAQDFKGAWFRAAKTMGGKLIDVNTEGEHDLCLKK